MQVAAFFDLDKTIIARSSTYAFSRPFYQGGLINRRAALRSAYAQLLLLQGGADADQIERMRAHLTALCQGWAVAQVRAADLRPRASHPSRAATADLLDRVRLGAVADQPVAALSHGQQRQLEIGMALAGAPRLILFDEPAAGLSPAERRELVALLIALPPHMGYIIIEHDLDVALRVVERVTVMHNGHVLKHGTPDEIEGDAEVQAIYIGGGHR